jgi:acyl-CoA hydrolase
MKTINESRSLLSEVMLPSQANPAGTVHGGEIMKLMDACGGVAATRHAKTNVVTVRVDELVFYQPIYVGQLVMCEAELAFVGKTSMEVRITVKVEDLMSDIPSKTALTAYFTYVALGNDKKPCTVPELLLENDEQRKAFEYGKIRYLEHKEKSKP